MEYNRTMRALAQEERLLHQARREPVVNIVLLMNEYHACDLKYFPSEEERVEHKQGISRLITRVSKQRGVPRHIQNRIRYWMESPEIWREELDTVHINR